MAVPRPAGPPGATDHCGGAPARPSRCVRESDRIHIADRLREKATIRQIATELGRSLSSQPGDPPQPHPVNGQ